MHAVSGAVIQLSAELRSQQNTTFDLITADFAAVSRTMQRKNICCLLKSTSVIDVNKNEHTSRDRPMQLLFFFVLIMKYMMTCHCLGP